MSKVLIVEDEVKIAQLLTDYLVQSNLETVMVHDGNAVLELVHNQYFDIILLDLMLPGKDGITLCKEIRQFSAVPIIMVTARVDEIDRLIGLELGADDYICKPFSPREVVARVKAVLRRTQSQTQSLDKSDTIKSTPKVVELDQDKYQARVFGIPVELTAIEFNLLQILAKEPGRIYSRSQLMNHVYHDHRVVSERTIDSHIKKLRKKLNDIKPDMELVQSVYSVGYKLEI
ncbi:MAG: two-component system response regulator BaeR [Moritella sp.]|uniref:response regulator n=1 Tax=Moritella sp. TaxID=78556 RepID=UPI000C0FB28C|nr:response regulator [Moritella sp.]MBL1417080.1 response regulator [Moritella sp.]PHR89642.1 MAG: two-component system response regulator BaeR [Moritella sp.]